MFNVRKVNTQFNTFEGITSNSSMILVLIILVLEVSILGKYGYTLLGGSKAVEASSSNWIFAVSLALGTFVWKLGLLLPTLKSKKDQDDGIDSSRSKYIDKSDDYFDEI